MTPEKRFFKYINKNTMTGCWLWQGEKVRSRNTTNFYGRFYVKQEGKKKIRVRAHRFMYELFNGTIPVGMEIDHLCRNTLCCNPEHIQVVTHSENVKRAWRERKK